ncbi:MAG: Ku protein [Alphaproteobacteria bacterium]|nr:MAG: Ku protein [Alphaproteobacteria bacterium]
MAAARRAYWKGYLKLSLVTCPVALYPASSQAEKTHFHQINRKTGHRLRQQMIDEVTGKAVDKDEKSRGYEVSKGKYVEIEPEEIKAIQVESTHTLDIEKFVPVDEIDRRYFDRPYYIVPDGKAGEEAFAVIRDAMKDKGRVALAKIVLTNRQHIMAIEPMGKILLGTLLRYDYEVRDEKELARSVPSPRIPKEMLSLASHILDTKAGHFDPSEFKDEFETELKKLVKRKAAGKPIEYEGPAERPSNVVDLMEALRQSVQGGGRRAAALRSSSASKKRSRLKSSHRRSSSKRKKKRAA